MADKHTEGSRAHRFEKKRKSTILMNWLVGAGSALLIVFIAMMVFGGDDQPSNAKGSDEEKAVLNSESDQKENSEEDKNNNGSTNHQTNKQDSEQEESNGSDPNSSSNTDSNNEESSDEVESSEEEQDKDATEEENDTDTVIEESDKENVAKIVKKDWQPVPTEMNTSGNHTISYNENSQDWNELIKAVSKATGLSKENMITWWIGNGGSSQKAEATVSNKEKTEHYRVFIQWVDGEGYKPVKLEVLEEKEVNR
ncbi:YrrS family protein [Halobacillus halophilus]|uniref:YrrS family protein n=1 Tax=Halobacillus halophilus TaxID=1570 RepID=UPI001CD6FA85|nr:YrrS family protein [Halobacillus halophilus]MCA1009764.1 YrrS family protein [Halobacillus halophilus]